MFARKMILLLTGLAWAHVARADSQFAGDGAKIYNAALASYNSGAYPEAATSYERCEALALTSVSRAASATGLGIALQRLGRTEESAQTLNRAVEIWGLVPDSGDQIARASLWLVEAERTIGHFGVVEQILRSALGTQLGTQQTHVLQPALEAELRNRLATILRETGKTEEARRELDAVQAMHGIPPGMEIDALLGKAELERHAMHYSDSLAALNRALKLADDCEDRRAESDALQGLGLTYLSLGDFARAEPALNRSLRLTETGEGSTPQRFGTALQCLAALHARNHKYALAEDELLRSLAGLRTTLPEGHPQIAAVRGDLAAVYREENRLDESLQCALQAWSGMRQSLGEESIGAAEALGVMAKTESQQRHFEDASRHYSLAIEILRRRGAERDVRMTTLMAGYAAVLDSQHRGVEAKQVRGELRNFCFANCNSDHN